MSNSRLDGPATYQIRVSGYLDRSWSAWFNNMMFAYDHESNDGPTTTLTGPVADQSSLRGILTKVWDLNLVLISLTLVRQNSSGVKQDDN